VTLLPTSTPHSQSGHDIAAWRKAERERLIGMRLAIDAATRHQFSVRIAATLDKLAGDISGRIVSLYWPIRGEADLRPWAERIRARGGFCALPVVVAKRTPLVFRAWDADTRLERGVWNIPVPAEGNAVTPDIVIAPVVGYDRACYRLGYGGGFFDRTLAAMPIRPRVIGVGYGCAEIATIQPQPHDIRMDMIVTEQGELSSP
jgi:5-formyltetrahydrofolate cyclo-ligase